MIDLARILLGRLRGETGQGLAEYTMIIAFVAIACILAVTALGLAVMNLYSDIVDAF